VTAARVALLRKEVEEEGARSASPEAAAVPLLATANWPREQAAVRRRRRQQQQPEQAQERILQ